jgi:hypothetical protein
MYPSREALVFPRLQIRYPRLQGRCSMRKDSLAKVNPVGKSMESSEQRVYVKDIDC